MEKQNTIYVIGPGAEKLKSLAADLAKSSANKDLVVAAKDLQEARNNIPSIPWHRSLEDLGNAAAYLGTVLEEATFKIKENFKTEKYYPAKGSICHK